MKDEAEWTETECIGTPPLPSFGHTATIIGKTKVVLFGGAIEVDHKLIMTDTVYIFSVYKSEWNKIEGSLPTSFLFSGRK